MQPKKYQTKKRTDSVAMDSKDVASFCKSGCSSVTRPGEQVTCVEECTTCATACDSINTSAPNSAFIDCIPQCMTNRTNACKFPMGAAEGLCPEQCSSTSSYQTQNSACNKDACNTACVDYWACRNTCTKNTPNDNCVVSCDFAWNQ